jgi:hypothetical protein
MKAIWIIPFSVAMSFGIANLGWAHGGGAAGGSSAHGGSSHSHASASRSRSHSHTTSSSHHFASTRSSRHSTHSTTARHLTKNGGLPGKKNGFVDGLPPGQEARVDRGKGLSPGWQNKVSFNARSGEDKETKGQSPGRELKSDREQEADRDR